jgi:hypothetical protein
MISSDSPSSARVGLSISIIMAVLPNPACGEPFTATLVKFFSMIYLSF